MKSGLSFLLIAAALVSGGLIAHQQLEPPAVKPMTAPTSEFSADRAWKHLEAIAQRPRPAGSDAHADVRSYLVQQLESLGLETVVQEEVVESMFAQGLGRSLNVIGRLRGERREGAVLLTAHYDSVPASPAASDDGAGVAALLEVARALTSGSRPAEDVIFLFSDGEEWGLLGAQAFADRHPWAQDVRLVLNVEARGVNGPSFLFETSPKNRQLIEVFAQNAPSALSFSFARDIYEVLPNLTDFTVYLQRRWPGLNFAHIGGALGYHSAQDTIERLDRRSLQHHGENLLGVAAFVSREGFTFLQARGEATYFNFPGLGLVHYSRIVDVVLLIVLLLSLLVVLRRAVLGRLLTAGGTVVGLASGFLVAALGAAGVLLVDRFLLRGARGLAYDIWGGQDSLQLHILAMVVIGAGVGIGALAFLRPRLTLAKLAAGSSVFVWVLAFASILVAPGAAYLFLWPLLFQVAALFFWFRGSAAGDLEQGREGIGAPWMASVFLAMAGFVAVVLWGTAFLALSMALGYVRLAGFGAAVGVWLVVVLAFFLVPQLESLLSGRLRWVVGILTVALGIGMAVGIARASSFGGSVNPVPSTLLYALDLDRDDALWATFRIPPDEFAGTYMHDDLEKRSVPEILGTEAVGIVAKAEVVALEAPRVEVLSQDRTLDGSRYRLRVTPGKGTDRQRLMFDASREVPTMTIAGIQLKPEVPRPRPPEGVVGTLFLAPPSEGYEVEIDVPGDAPFNFTVVDQRYGFPELPGGHVPARPPWSVQAGQAWNTDSSFVRKAFQLDPQSGLLPSAADVAEESQEAGSL